MKNPGLRVKLYLGFVALCLSAPLYFWVDPRFALEALLVGFASWLLIVFILMLLLERHWRKEGIVSLEAKEQSVQALNKKIKSVRIIIPTYMSIALYYALLLTIFEADGQNVRTAVTGLVTGMGVTIVMRLITNKLERKGRLNQP